MWMLFRVRSSCEISKRKQLTRHGGATGNYSFFYTVRQKQKLTGRMVM